MRRLLLLALLAAPVPALRQYRGTAPRVPQAPQATSPACGTKYFIHIGKTGGTTVFRWLEHLYRGHLRDYGIVFLRGHSFQLGFHDPAEKDACYFFFVRDPTERWVSGFLSHYRKGCPAHCKEEWGPHLKAIFDAFPTPNALAEGFSSSDVTVRKLAQHANNFMHHTSHAMASYLPNLTSYLPRIVFVGRTDSMEEDFPLLARKLGLPEEGVLKIASEKALRPVNVNPPEMEPMKEISELAKKNLRELLVADYEVLDVLYEAGFIPTTHLQKHSCAPGQRNCTVEMNGGYSLAKGRPLRDNTWLEDIPDAYKDEEIEGEAENEDAERE